MNTIISIKFYFLDPLPAQQGVENIQKLFHTYQ